MNIKHAANIMRDLINKSWNLEESGDNDSSSKSHLLGMCRKIEIGAVSGDKAHRWLGWIQGCVYIGCGGTLDDMKRINKESQDIAER